MKTQMKSKHPKILFEIDQSSSCCGVLEVHGFVLQTKAPSWYTPPSKIETFKSVAAQMDYFETTLFEKIKESIRHNNNNGGGGYLLTATLLSHDRFLNGPQFPELGEYFLKSGWVITNTFKNRNTGNDINYYTRFVTEDELRASGAIDDDEDEDGDEEDEPF